jgi:hypothetical protein
MLGLLDGYSCILEVYNKDTIKETNDELGITVLRFSDEQFYEIWKM